MVSVGFAPHIAEALAQPPLCSLGFLLDGATLGLAQKWTFVLALTCPHYERILSFFLVDVVSVSVNSGVVLMHPVQP